MIHVFVDTDMEALADIDGIICPHIYIYIYIRMNFVFKVRIDFLCDLAQPFGDPVYSYGQIEDPLCSEGQGGLSALSGCPVCEHLEVSGLK